MARAFHAAGTRRRLAARVPCASSATRDGCPMETERPAWVRLGRIACSGGCCNARSPHLTCQLPDDRTTAAIRHYCSHGQPPHQRVALKQRDLSSDANIFASSGICTRKAGPPACSQPHLSATARTEFTDAKPIIYAGCYKPAPGFNNVMPGDSSMTLETCYNAVYSAGYTMFAVQADGSCFSATSAALSAAQHLGDAECSAACPGDVSQKCGGQQVFAVYRIAGE